MTGLDHLDAARRILAAEARPADDGGVHVRDVNAVYAAIAHALIAIGQALAVDAGTADFLALDPEATPTVEPYAGPITEGMPMVFRSTPDAEPITVQRQVPGGWEYTDPTWHPTRPYWISDENLRTRFWPELTTPAETGAPSNQDAT